VFSISWWKFIVCCKQPKMIHSQFHDQNRTSKTEFESGQRLPKFSLNNNYRF
jgi:hypothetical protein